MALQLARSDALTELDNRRYIFEQLADLLLGSRTMRWPLTVAMLDIDHFKHINDSQGHATGDAVLRHFAGLLRRQLRPADAVGRIGGEEFLLLLPNASLDGAVADAAPRAPADHRIHRGGRAAAAGLRLLGRAGRGPAR